MFSYCDLQYIDVKTFSRMCSLFPEFRERFVQDLSLDFSCNLWELHEDIKETYGDVPEPTLPEFTQRRNRRNKSTSATSSQNSLLPRGRHFGMSSFLISSKLLNFCDFVTPKNKPKCLPRFTDNATHCWGGDKHKTVRRWGWWRDQTVVHFWIYTIIREIMSAWLYW